MKKSGFELILCIVNAGFAETVMDAAYAYGARGGTVIQARGTANKEAEKEFKITIQPEKEMLMLVVPSEIKDDILHALYRSVGLNSPGHGIAFSLPVDNVIGLNKSMPQFANHKPEHKSESEHREHEHKEHKEGSKPEHKDEVKPEHKPEHKDEVKPNHKHEAEKAHNQGEKAGE